MTDTLSGGNRHCSRHSSEQLNHACVWELLYIWCGSLIRWAWCGYLWKVQVLLYSNPCSLYLNQWNIKQSVSHFCNSLLSLLSSFVQVTGHPEPVSQSMSLQQPPQSQYNMPDRDKQLLFSEFEDLSASFRSLYKSVFEQSFSQQGKWAHGSIKWKPNRGPKLQSSRNRMILRTIFLMRVCS